MLCGASRSSSNPDGARIDHREIRRELRHRLRIGVDGDDRCGGRRQSPRQPPVAAADFENAARGARDTRRSRAQRLRGVPGPRRWPCLLQLRGRRSVSHAARQDASDDATVRLGGGPMPGVRILAVAAVAAWSVTALGQAPATGVTVFEGARVIVGDARAPIENASFVVNGARFVQVGRAADVRVPAGATRVNLAGKTVMPAIIDTHTHLSQTREMLIDDLRRRAYFGVGAAHESRSGHDGRVIPGSRADDAGPGEVLHGRARDHGAGAGAHDRAVLGHDDRGGAQGGAGKRGQESRHHQDLGRRSPGHGEEALARALHARSSTKRTRTAFASSRTSTRSRMRRRRCAPASTRSRTACATRTSTTSSWRSSSSIQTWCSGRTCPIAAWWRTSTGCGRPSAAAEFETLQKGNTNRPDAQAFWGIQARNLAKMNAAGVRIVVGTDGNTPYAPHVEMADMVAAGHDADAGDRGRHEQRGAVSRR